MNTINKVKEKYTIHLPSGEKKVGHYYSAEQAKAHGIQICLQRYLNINKLIITKG